MLGFPNGNKGLNMSNSVKWIKITTDIFDDEKILLIESMPDSYAIITVWFKLLCLAGKQNNSGVFMLNDRIPYTGDMLATIFRMKPITVKLALETFQNFGMIEIIDDVITIPNWGKHQSIEQMEEFRERNRIYMKEYRERQKQKVLVDKEEEVEDKSVYSKGFVEFWDAYPRKDDKGACYRKYKARLNDGYSEAELLSVAKAYADECKKNHTEKKYIKMGKTFLGDATPFIKYLPKDDKVKVDFDELEVLFN